MKRRGVLGILSACVTVFCLHNVYQSSTIVHVSRVQLTSHMLAPLPEGIEIIAGGSHNKLADLVAWNASARELYMGQSNDRHWALQPLGPGRPQQQVIARAVPNPNGPKVIDTIPGRRRTASRGHNQRGAPGYDVGLQFNESLPMLDLPERRCVVNKSTSFNHKYVNGTKIQIPLWQQKLKSCGRLGYNVNGTWKFILAELLQVRIYDEDKAQWTIRELKQWLHYMYLVGVEHVFICDHYRLESERLDVPLQRYIEHGLVTYIPWNTDRNPMNAQIRCYQHIIDNYKQHTRWQMAVDMDEYPWTPLDNREGALVRYIRNITRRLGTRISEISMSNYLMLGQGDRSRDIVIERINRMTPNPANVLVKPIYRPERVRANIHHNHLQFGNQMSANTSELRMLHYWGARGQEWGEDTKHTLSITKEMNVMRDSWPRLVRQSLLAFGEYDAFSNSTGP